MSWAETRLKHLCTDSGQYGLNVPADQYRSSGTRLIRTSDIAVNGELKSAREGVFVDAVLEPRHQLRQGDILLSRSGTLGRSLLVPAGADGHSFAGFLIRFRPNSDAEPRFLKYATQSAPFQGVVHSEAVSSTIQNFNADRYANIPLRAPDVDEQRRIADFLDVEIARVDALITARNSQVRGLEQLWEARLASRVDGLIATYGLVALRRLVTSVEQGWSPQCEDSEAAPQEWAILKTSAVSSGRFKPLEHKRLPNSLEPDLRHEITDGDILMTRGSGSPAHVGVAAVARTEGRRLLLSDLLYRVRLASGWSPEFVALLLGSRPVRGRMALLFRGQSGQTIKLRAEDIKAIEIPAVPSDVQDEISDALTRVRRDIISAQQAIHQSSSLLAERRQALITAAVTGQFDVSTAGGRNVTDGVTASP
ncbi:restriction endonuclease subunit S [Streptomyces sp. NBC_00820]|uniref:restriction endonuclease subunit S n=1 Tax=Streptomyces sp. NBC_00820 TaxID=2975842 RepID=UPI002ED25957|nr:restriction endonuclease subunit S [Streptomyces sp. NBC_00820]